ncbi:MAG TPA: SEC-C metal-binding domain-containing protein [Candidatus Dojkabacteria bacterium]|nr:SEC-C metal-binding domain-containing protein [Candidatus Dojkabacteria bacterium]
MLKIFSKLFDSNEKQIDKAKPIIAKINQLDDYVANLSDEKLKEKTIEFRNKLGVDLEKVRQLNESNIDVTKASKSDELKDEQAKLLEILPEAFAVVREASLRVANHRHFDVQLTAGYFLFTNKIVELFTGEGKTLAANLPLYLYALTGKGAHLVTVNDYLARRDAEWNGHILNALGMTVGAINNNTQYRFVTDEEAIKIKGDEAKKLIKQRDELAKKVGRLKYDHMSGVNLVECSKKEAYACDVVYGTNNEFGFDYLRDNMARSIEDRVQGPLHYVIVDEADSILIDEARTPLIISQSADDSNELYQKFASIVSSLEIEKHYTVDEKSHAVVPTDEGINAVEKALGVKNIYSDAKYAYHLDNALKAKELYHLDDEYIIRDGEVLIVDEFTGRILKGRRYSEGLHQAIEAKEQVEVKKESRTLATITLQNYFRLYDFASGMTGTALTESEEFANIYNLDVIVIPTNKPVIRKDNPDVVYRTQAGKFRAIVNDINEHNLKGQPVLVGTTSVEKSEILSELLTKEGIRHNVLNAKFHDKEAKIVSEAGQKGMVTIATNMAGRGTDISLGEGVKELGGLYIIGSERHESRRIDNQLRGRSGRQGDPGESQFFVSFEDDLMRIFGGDNMSLVLSRVGMEDDMPISASILGKTIESAQKRVESYNYDIRKHLVEYDDVLNQQREIIYGMRRRLLKLISTGEKNAPNAFKEGNDFKLSPKEIQEIDVNNLIASVDAFALRNPDTYEIADLSKFENVNEPLNTYILKKIVEYVRFTLASKLRDDMEIDQEEEIATITLFRNLFGEDLYEVSSKLLGFKGGDEFAEEFDKIKEIPKKQYLIFQIVLAAFIFHVSMVGPRAMIELVRMLVLQTLDNMWMEHLDTMTDLREGIGLRGLAQKDPLVEYKNEGFRLFDQMLVNVDNAIVTRFFKMRVVQNNAQSKEIEKADGKMLEIKRDVNSFGGNDANNKKGISTLGKMVNALSSSMNTSNKQINDTNQDNRPGQVGGQKTVKNLQKVGRNDPCPCGSGKKYKKCCGR